MDLFETKICLLEWQIPQATFQRLVNEVVSGIDTCDIYTDDAFLSGNCFEHLQTIRKDYNKTHYRLRKKLIL